MTFLTNDEVVGRAMKRLRPALAAYVERILVRNSAGLLPAVIEEHFPDKREFRRPFEQWDTWQILQLMRASWGRVDWSHVEYSLVVGLLDVRNLWAHERGFSQGYTDEACRLIDRFHQAISPTPGPRVLDVFKNKIEKELRDPSWVDVLSRVWPTEWRGDYLLEPNGGATLHGAGFCSSPGDPGLWEGVSPYVLPMDCPYGKVDRSPAVSLAGEILESMTYRNSAVFLAVDDRCVSSLRKDVCRLRAWEGVLREGVDLTPQEKEGVDASLDQACRVLVNQLREGYRWLLVPSQSSSASPVEWKAIELEESQNPVERAGLELESVGGVLTRLDPSRLVEELDRMAP